MDDRIKQMINSDDPEIAEIGAKLLVQEDKTQKRIKIPKWFIEFYEDTKGNLHSRFIKKAIRENSGIYIKSLKDINSLIELGFSHSIYTHDLEHLLEYDSILRKIKEKEL
jgi:hypothetical protein